MTDLVMVALIASTPPTIAAVGGIAVSILNRRNIAQANTKIDNAAATVETANAKLAEVHHQINSRMDELLATAKTGAFAEGKLEGQNPTT